MGVSLQQTTPLTREPKGAAARTRKLMVETAVALMQRGETPSVSVAAEAAGVSRATAYRYFPSQAALVGAVVNEGLGPILSWDSSSDDALERVEDLLRFSLPRIIEFESTFKAALKLSLEHWAQDRAGTHREEAAFKRGHRIELLKRAIAPLRGSLSRAQFSRLAEALSLTYGLEVLTVLKDLWGLKPAEIQNVTLWAGRALVTAAMAEAGLPSSTTAKKERRVR